MPECLTTNASLVAGIGAVWNRIARARSRDAGSSGALEFLLRAVCHSQRKDGVKQGSDSGCGGSFSLACEDFRENVGPFIPTPFSFFLSSFFEAEISSSALIPLLRPGSVHSGPAS